MNWEVHSPQNARSEVYKSGNPGQYRKSRYDLCNVIRDAKRQNQTKIESQTNHMDTHCLWQGLLKIAGYKVKSISIVDNRTSLPDELDAFDTHLEQKWLLTSVNMKCIERLVMAHIDSSLPNCIDPLHNRSTANTISLVLHSSPKYLDNMDIYIPNHNKTEYKEIEGQAAWCKHNLSINVREMKELVIDFRKRSGGQAPVCITGAELEMLESVKFQMVKKAQQRLYFLRRQRKFSMSTKTLISLYRCTTESIHPEASQR
eukprot:g35779.t1